MKTSLVLGLVLLLALEVTARGGGRSSGKIIPAFKDKHQFYIPKVVVTEVAVVTAIEATATVMEEEGEEEICQHGPSFSSLSSSSLFFYVSASAQVIPVISEQLVLLRIFPQCFTVGLVSRAWRGRIVHTPELFTMRVQYLATSVLGR